MLDGVLNRGGSRDERVHKAEVERDSALFAES